MTAKEWIEVVMAVGALVTAFGGATGLRALLRRRKRMTATENAVALSTGTLKWAEALTEQTDRLTARVEAAERKADAADEQASHAARRAADADARAGRLERQLEEVVAYMDTLLEAINDPDGLTPEQQLAHIRRVATRRPVALRKETR